MIYDLSQRRRFMNQCLDKVLYVLSDTYEESDIFEALLKTSDSVVEVAHHVTT